MCQVQMVNAEFFHKLQRKPYPHRMQSLPRVAHRKSRQRLSYENINRRGCLVPVLTHFFPSACTAIALCPEAPATPIQTITQLSKRTHYLTLEVRVQSEWLKIIFTNHIVTRNNLQKPRFAKRYTWLYKTLHVDTKHKHSKKKKSQMYSSVKVRKCLSRGKGLNSFVGWVSEWHLSKCLLRQFFLNIHIQVVGCKSKMSSFRSPSSVSARSRGCQCWRKIALYIVWLYLCNQSYKR